MQTRSMSKIVEYKVNIDFDEASRYWHSNKKKLPNCCYQYVCGFQKQNGNFCKKTRVKNKEHCNQHSPKTI